MAHSLARTHTAPHWAVWLSFVVLCNAAGFLSSLAAGETQIYAQLQQPYFAPPSWVFAPVWTTLYVLMGTATYLVWRDSAGRRRRKAMMAFGVQLALNAMWTPVFFGMKQYAAALVVLVAIWIAVWTMFVLYWRRNRFAGYMTIPLLFWVTFAGVLNAAIVRLN